MSKQDKRMQFYLQDKILKDISFENLPAKWQGFDLAGKI